MDQAALIKVGMALGVLFGVYKFVDKPVVRAMVLGVAGTIIAKQVPYVKDAI